MYFLKKLLFITLFNISSAINITFEYTYEMSAPTPAPYHEPCDCIFQREYICDEVICCDRYEYTYLFEECQEIGPIECKNPYTPNSVDIEGIRYCKKGYSIVCIEGRDFYGDGARGKSCEKINNFGNDTLCKCVSYESIHNLIEEYNSNDVQKPPTHDPTIEFYFYLIPIGIMFIIFFIYNKCKKRNEERQNVEVQIVNPLIYN